MTQYCLHPVRALSIAGPFARLIAQGSKEIELRSWTTNYRGLVLLHSSTNRDYDSYFPRLGISPHQCPKSAIIGAVILTGCITYNLPYFWYRDLKRHRWMGDEPYAIVRYYYYNDNPPIGHIFSRPILFDKPILDVPGAFNYWQPKNLKQKLAFERALAIVRAVN